MTVTERLNELQARTVVEIERLQDFHVFTGHSYGRYHMMVEQGHISDTVVNVRTQTNMSSQDLAVLLLKYLDGELPIVVTYQIVSCFEYFFFEFLKILLQDNCNALNKKKMLSVENVLDASNLNELKDFLVDRELGELRYGKVVDWFSYLEKIINLKGIESANVERLSELKATRDIFAHNSGIVNEIYIRKAGKLARANLGEMLSLSRSYVYESADFLKGLVKNMSESSITRMLKKTKGHD